ncbi:transcription antitermination factor NusB [Siculibacillus lacustris]|uniref:Transcription antitermination protein NusB n=1 Tax=Siculibacillus lacustris TaxID=1549641 RepID=A0A4Q9VVF1_9HYPH|nr:transcription antitermination factor NusB [Siculibacillus lacustris]TBW39720.1 transcription antitermination factor NusB [Siculibacillus lacustris]
MAEPVVPRETKPANKRGVARLAAVQALYQMEIGGAELADVVDEFETFRFGREIDGEEYREADPVFFREILAGVVAHQRVIDPRVNAALVEGWPLKRVDVTLREILRAGAWELYKRKDIPARVVINEYVDVAKAFFVEDEPKIVNGVLDRIAHELRTGEFEP